MAADSDNGGPMAGIVPGTPVILIAGDPDRTARVLEALETRGLRVVEWTPRGANTGSNGPRAGDSKNAIDEVDSADVWVVKALHVPDAVETLRPMSPFSTIQCETPSEATVAPSLEGLEWAHIQRVLSECGGNISATARRLGIHRRSLQRKLAKVPPTR